MTPTASVTANKWETVSFTNACFSLRCQWKILKKSLFPQQTTHGMINTWLFYLCSLYFIFINNRNIKILGRDVGYITVWYYYGIHRCSGAQLLRGESILYITQGYIRAGIISLTSTSCTFRLTLNCCNYCSLPWWNIIVANIRLALWHDVWVRIEFKCLTILMW